MGQREVIHTMKKGGKFYTDRFAHISHWLQIGISKPVQIRASVLNALIYKRLICIAVSMRHKTIYMLSEGD